MTQLSFYTIRWQPLHDESKHEGEPTVCQSTDPCYSMGPTCPGCYMRLITYATHYYCNECDFQFLRPDYNPRQK